MILVVGRSHRRGRWWGVERTLFVGREIDIERVCDVCVVESRWDW